MPYSLQNSLNKTIYTWDLGATKCAAGVVEYDSATHQFRLKNRCHVKLADTTSLLHLIQTIEAQLGLQMHEADAICIGAAGLYDGENLLLHKYTYPMNFKATASNLGWKQFAVIHDYATILCATFTDYITKPENVKRLNQQPIVAHGRRIAFGVGTGLGLKDGVLLENGDFWLGQNEIGHIGIITPPDTQTMEWKRHLEFSKFLNHHLRDHAHPYVTLEKILSGVGLTHLYHFLHSASTPLTPEQVGSLVQEGKADDVLNAFAWYLGLFVGTIQLSFMPLGGIWMTGGVALNHLRAFDSPEFNKGIHASPAFLEQRSAYPLGVLCNDDHALIGGAFYAIKRLLANTGN